MDSFLVAPNSFLDALEKELIGDEEDPEAEHSAGAPPAPQAS